MKYRRFGDTLAVRIDRGEEIVTELLALAEKESIRFGSIQGFGACDHAVLGVYSVEEQKYYAHTFDEEMELTTLLGNFSTLDGKPYLHVHVTLGLEDGRCIGGHLNEARISGTSEIFVQTYPVTVDRYKDEKETGLNLWDL